jgi:DNA-binding IclR family transcriptional regulator
LQYSASRIAEVATVESQRQSGTGFARDLDLLEVIALATARQQGGVRLTDIARATRREKSQVSRALSRLESAGLVARDRRTREFGLGWRLYQLAALTAEAHLIACARPVMHQVVAHLGETTHLCVLRGTSCVTVHSELPAHGFRGLSWLGVEAPAHTLTAGRVLLAEWSPAEIEAAYPEEELPDVRAIGRIRTRRQLTAECEQIREHGYAMVDEEFEEGLVGASAAIRDFRGIAIASLNVAAPKGRLGTRLAPLGLYLAGVCEELSHSLGHRRVALPE